MVLCDLYHLSPIEQGEPTPDVILRQNDIGWVWILMNKACTEHLDVKMKEVVFVRGTCICDLLQSRSINFFQEQDVLSGCIHIWREKNASPNVAQHLLGATCFLELPPHVQAIPDAVDN